jgi:hypothetical protein
MLARALGPMPGAGVVAPIAGSNPARMVGPAAEVSRAPAERWVGSEALGSPRAAASPATMVRRAFASAFPSLHEDLSMADIVPRSDGLGGQPGTRWRNPTSATWYQLVSSLRKPCAFCLRRHARVSPRPWPLPLHPHCQCEQLEVPPGREAPLPFTDLPALMPRLSVSDRMELVGIPGWLLERAGLVRWSDLFGPDGEPLDFDRVVRRRGLSFDGLRAAGISEATARRAVGLGPLGR